MKPKVNDGESQSEFIARFMDDPDMAKEYPDREERSVVAYSTWRESKDGKTAGPVKAKAKETEGFVKGVRMERTFLDAKLFVGKEGGDGDAGWIEGYANAFNNLDWYREIVRPGTWKQSIKERVPAGKVKLMVRHFAFGGDSTDLIGTITEAKEDDFGLWYHAELSSVKLAQDSRTLVTEGHLNFNSVGFMPLEYKEIAEWDDGLPATELLKAIWLETTLTNVPANDQSIITAAKNILAQTDSALEGREVLSAEDLGKAEKLLAQLSSLSEGVEKLISLNSPQPEVDLLGLQLDIDSRRKRLELFQAAL